MALNHFLISCLDCCLVPWRRRRRRWLPDKCGPASPIFALSLRPPLPDLRLFHSVVFFRHLSLFLRLLSRLIYLLHLFPLIPPVSFSFLFPTLFFTLICFICFPASITSQAFFFFSFCHDILFLFHFFSLYFFSFHFLLISTCSFFQLFSH